MRATIKTLLAVLPALLLAACGGGGGGGSDSGFNTPALSVSVNATSTTSTPGSLVPLTVRVTGGNGGSVADGTQVTLRVSPPGVGLVSFASASPPPNGGGTALLQEAVTGTTSGGVANFRLHTRAVGTASLTASVNDGARSVTGSAQVTVSAGSPNDPRLAIDIESITLPVNTQGVPVFVGSPYTAQATITWRNIDGTLVTPRDDDDTVAVAINNAGGNGQIAAFFSTLDDPETRDVNELTDVLLGQGPVDVVAGRALIFIHAGPNSGTATLTASVVDQLTGETVSLVRTITVTSGTPQVPGAVIITAGTEPVYIQGVNGNQSKALQVAVNDGGGTRVPNPAAGVNNVRLEIVGGAQGGERLIGVGANGATQTGGTINVRSNNGIASASYQSGTRSGEVTLRATADRADNNVDNGIQDPVTSTRGFAVSDGRLFDIDITTPTIGAIVVNGAFGPDGEGITVTNPGGGGNFDIPLSPDATYSLTVSAIAVDRFGNPVPAGTEIRFGSIDSPLVNNFFAIAGNNGDPQEGGTTFTAANGAFTTAGGGVGPGDTLLVFGEQSNGNRDLESARTVASVQSPTSLTTQSRFNFNDDTGTSVNNGPVLPYVIGRNTAGSIQIAGLTNAAGVATVRLTYPVSQLGRTAGIWAQAPGDLVNGTPEIVTDVEIIGYPGVSPATLTAEPSQIIGNRTQDVTVCVRDALGSGIGGLAIGFSFENLSGTGSVDGVANSGVVADPTGPDGCTVATVTTTGVVQPGTGGGTTTPQVRFFVGALFDTVTITVGQQVLTAVPSSFVGNGTRQILLTLLDAGGNPVPGVQLRGTCTPGAGTSLAIGNIPVTDANGRSITTITAQGFEVIGSTPPTGTCRFETLTGTPFAIVTATGINICNVGTSPFPPVCGTTN